MRNILFALVLSVFSVAALADTPLAMGVNPNKPLIVTSNAVIDPGGANEMHLTGPWFNARFIAYNGGMDAVTITGFMITVTAADGTIKTITIAVDHDATIAYNQKYIQSLYVDALPASTSYVYQVMIEVQGYIGTKDNKSADLDPSKYRFITQ